MNRPCIIFLLVFLIAAGGCDYDRGRSRPLGGILGLLAQATTTPGIVVGQYCGQTAPLDGNAGGYATIHTLCVAACGSSTAHLCSPAELQLGAEFGIVPPSDSWYGSFMIHSDAGSGQTGQDCVGWRVTTSTTTGAVIVVSSSSPGRAPCNSSYPFACCDFRVLAP